MKAEKYLLDQTIKNNISIEQIKCDIGINIAALVDEKKELEADDFMTLCRYLGVNPDDVMEYVAGTANVS